MNFSYANQLELINNSLFNIKEKISLSFEFFPPKTYELENFFWKNIYLLNTLKPNFFSVTCSSSTGSADITYKLVKKIKEKIKTNTAPHITCINLSIDKIKEIATKYLKNNIFNIIALRGDLLVNKQKNKIYGLDLVKLLKKIGNFDISVAAYPEVHPEAKNAHFDLINLKKKIDAGANRAITQFFFDTNKYLHFRDKCFALGIKADIVPGILPIFNFKQVKHFAKITNVSIPLWLHKMFEGLDSDIKSRKIIGASIAIDTIKTLVHEGVRNFHFYTLNDAELTYAICCLLRKTIKK